jgi:hypothetical protein
MRTGVRWLAVAAVSLFMLTQGAAAAVEPLRLTKNAQATKDDLNPTRTYSAPVLAVDPANEMNVVGSFIDFRTGRCGLMRSSDAGQTWKRLDALPALPSFPFCESTMSGNGIWHTPIAFGRNSTLYYGMIGWDTQDGGGRQNTSLMLAQSKNFGESWDTTLVRNNRGKVDQAVENIRPITGVVVDSKSGSADIVYVSYSRRLPNVLAPNAEPNQPTVVVSTDGGRTFGEPIGVVDGAFSPAVRAEAFSRTTTTFATPGTTTTTIPTPPGSRAAQPDQEVNFGGGKASMTIDKENGTVYLAWPSATANLATPPPPGYFLSKSTDQGKTWTVTQIAPFSYNNRAGAPGPASSVRMAWSPKGGPEGTLHLVAEGTDQPAVANLSHIFYYRSTDGGRTWSDPKIIDDSDKSQLVSQYMPDLTVAPDGRVDVVWWDTRDDPSPFTNDVYYTSSTDNGNTFSRNIRITDRPINRRYGVFLNNFNMSSPPGIASTNSYALVAWDDTRLTDPTFADNNTTGGGLQDIFTSAVQYKALGGGASKAVKLVLAGVVGLLVVGLLLFATSFGARGRHHEKGQAVSPRPATVDADLTRTPS